MLIEFETINSTALESYERQLLAESDLNNDPVPFHHKEDYKSITVFDIKDVVGFDEGTVWENSTLHKCVYAHLKDGTLSRNLLITGEAFKKVIEVATGVKILNHREL